MNILLDYFFPITAIDPTPQASTSFLKQVLVVGKPKDEGVTPDIISLCTTMTAVEAIFGSQASAEVQELFDAGMNKVYVLPVETLGLASDLDGHAEFFTLLVSSDFGDEDIAQDITTPAVAAYLHEGDLTFTAVKAGTVGNAITVELIDDVTSGEEFAHAIGNAITVHIEDGVSSADIVKAAIDDSVSAAALITVAVDSGQGAIAQSAFAATNLDHGAQAIYNDGTGIQVGTFKGVVGMSSEDGDVLAAQAVIKNRVAFHTTSDNKAKNMFYAFGKLLSNALNWRNQQYIAMPLADDVDTLGDANNLFDDKVSFVIDDSEFGSRLGLFAVGRKAIVAPYIVRNLEIDFQSAALSYISGNQPAFSKKQAALVEDELYKVIQSYIAREWITAGIVTVSLVENNFVANGEINIAEPKALWRIFGEMRQTL